MFMRIVNVFTYSWISLRVVNYWTVYFQKEVSTKKKPVKFLKLLRQLSNIFTKMGYALKKKMFHSIYHPHLLSFFHLYPSILFLSLTPLCPASSHQVSSFKYHHHHFTFSHFFYTLHLPLSHHLIYILCLGFDMLDCIIIVIFFVTILDRR